jgi:hypothetical protein
MRHFLIVYQRAKGRILELEEYGPGEQEVALSEAFQRELEHIGDSDVEVVVLGSASRQTLERTHSRYFRSLDDVVREVRALS